MEVISYIALILLLLFGYSSGAAIKSGKHIQLNPQSIDLIMLLLIYASAIYSRVALNFNKWLIVLVWLIFSIILGIVAVWLRELTKVKPLDNKNLSEDLKNIHKNLWQKWKDFSKRTGSFQSRIILALYFFIIISPFALALKIFSDPLQIKQRASSDSFWLAIKQIKTSLSHSRRQF